MAVRVSAPRLGRPRPDAPVRPDTAEREVQRIDTVGVIFGEVGLLEDAARSASVVTVKDVVTYSLGYSMYRSLFDETLTQGAWRCCQNSMSAHCCEEDTILWHGIRCHTVVYCSYFIRVVIRAQARGCCMLS